MAGKYDMEVRHIAAIRLRCAAAPAVAVQGIV